MTTAPGIRKNNKDDQELGEDAVGFTSKGKYVVLWVADGAPGQSMIFEDLDFSPRVLAKYVGECFEETVFKNGVAKIPFDKAFVTDFIHTLDEKISIRISDMHTKFATMHNVNFDDILEYQETPAKDDPANLPATPVNVATINPDVTAKVEAILNVATPQGDSKVKVVSTDPSKEEKKDDTAQLSPDTIYLNNHKVKASIKVFDFLKGKGKQKPVQESKNEVPVVLVAPPLVAPATPAAPTLIAPMTIPIVKVATDEPVIIKKADASDAVIPIVVQGEPSYGLAPVATPATAAVTPSTTTLVDTVIPPTTVIPPVIPMPKPVAPPKNVVKMNKTYGITWAVAFTGALIDTEKKIGSIISIGDCIALFNPAEGYEVQIDNKIPASTTIIHDPTNSKKPDVPLVTVDSSQDIPCRVPSAVEVKSVQEAQEAPDENEDREEDNESIQQTVAAQDKITKKSFSIGEITSKITGTISEYTS